MKFYYPFLLTGTIVILFFSNCKEKKIDAFENRFDSFDGTTITDINYGGNTDYKGKFDSLALDIYQPKGSSATNKHPFILFIHGGGYEVGDKKTTQSFCEMMAGNGYIVASINYRLGWPKNADNPCDADSTDAIKAFYRAQQDAHAAMRFLMSNADKYGIDTSWVFVSGSSAGAVSSLGLQYYSQQVTDSIFPAVSKSLGALNGGDNGYTAGFKIKGIACMWGALNTPDLITAANAVPTIFFHGEKDKFIPCNIGHFYSCNNYPMNYGAKPLYNRLMALGVSATAYIDPEGGHGVYSQKFRADKIISFFNNIMKYKAQTGYFISDNVGRKG